MPTLAIVAKSNDPPLSAAREQLRRRNAAGLFLLQLRRGGLFVR
jgi:hypothetical protein